MKENIVKIYINEDRLIELALSSEDLKIFMTIVENWHIE